MNQQKGSKSTQPQAQTQPQKGTSMNGKPATNQPTNKSQDSSRPSKQS